MKLELHIIQNFAPSCLNRDDVNAPKDCEFGGFRRARISSQCLKRSIRNYWSDHGLLQNERANRTRRVVAIVTDKLVEKGRDYDNAKAAVKHVLEEACGFAVKDDGTTEYLLFLSEPALDKMCDLINQNWDELMSFIDANVQSDEGKAKKARKKVVPKELSSLYKTMSDVFFDSTRAADLAMFGRMIADRPDQNVDAACQVAHAFSTHRVSMEVDYFTAVDDLQQDETGAGMIGVVEFNSACFYRYSLIDYNNLVKNLGSDQNLAGEVVRSYVKAAILSIPSGKQNSMAAHNLPSFVFAVVRSGGSPWSLANAFENPVYPLQNNGLISQSIKRLDEYWAKMTTRYGNDGIKYINALVLDEAPLTHISSTANNIDELVECITKALEE